MRVRCMGTHAVFLFSRSCRRLSATPDGSQLEHLVGRLRHFRTVRDDDDATMPIMRQRSENTHDVVLGGQVEIAGRLVRDDDGRARSLTRGRSPRCCSPPDRCRIRSFVYSFGRCTCSSSSSTIVLRLVERFAGRVHRQDDVLRDRKVRQQVEVLEDHADVVAAETVAVAFRQVGAIDQTMPSVGVASPEMSDSSVVLPAPDGPVMACTLPA